MAIGTDVVTMSRGYTYRDLVAQTVFEHLYGWTPDTPLKYSQNRRFTATFSRSLKNMEQKGWVERRHDIEVLKGREAGAIFGYWRPRTLLLTTEGGLVLKDTVRKQRVVTVVNPDNTRTTTDDKIADAQGELTVRAWRLMRVMRAEDSKVANTLMERCGRGADWLKLARMALGERIDLGHQNTLGR